LFEVNDGTYTRQACYQDIHKKEIDYSLRDKGGGR
jgi:hypothetical protein